MISKMEIWLKCGKDSIQLPILPAYRAYKPFTYKELKVKTYDQLRTEVIQ